MTKFEENKIQSEYSGCIFVSFILLTFFRDEETDCCRQIFHVFSKISINIMSETDFLKFGNIKEKNGF